MFNGLGENTKTLPLDISRLFHLEIQPYLHPTRAEDNGSITFLILDIIKL